MKKTVNDLVNKQWAKSAREILTRSSQDITSIFDELLTMTEAEVQGLKSQAACDRFTQALTILRDGLNFGWAHGFNSSQARFTRPAKKQPNRRVGALLPLAVGAGEAIGKAQAAKIAKAHSQQANGNLALRHTHANRAS
jgi:hypothetical protein